MSVTKPWENHQKVVKKYIDDNGYDNFLREPTIKGTMFVGENDTTVEEFKRLVKNKDWDRKWESAIYDAGIGNPERFSLYPKSSGNYIHCAYHLSEYERIHNIDISELDCIVEVGCGYGAMAKVCRDTTQCLICRFLMIFKWSMLQLTTTDMDYVIMISLQKLVNYCLWKYHKIAC
jgi:hypothetical protein